MRGWNTKMGGSIRRQVCQMLLLIQQQQQVRQQNL
jgi:hypothetical protein